MIDVIKKIDEYKGREVLDEIKQNWKVYVDVLLKCVEDYANERTQVEEGDMTPLSVIASIFLLAEHGEKRTFPSVVKIYTKEGTSPWEELNDKLPSILVSIFDGDFELLNSVIENNQLNEFTREDFLRCYTYFYNDGSISEKELKDYLLKLIEKFEYDDSIYDGILEVIIDTHMFSMMEDVKKMFREDAIDLRVRGGYDDFLDDIFDYGEKFDSFTKIEDASEELGWYEGFERAEKEKHVSKKAYSKALEDFVSMTVEKMYNPNKIGRNEPCPCGSGKKYKKCCMDKDKKDMIILPYQNFINDSLQKYPKAKDDDSKKDLYDFYDEDYIELDKLLYKVLKRRSIPLFVQRDLYRENLMDLKVCREAMPKMKELAKKVECKTFDEFDKKVAVHFSLYAFVMKYHCILSDLHAQPSCPNRKELVEEMAELDDFLYERFDWDGNANEIVPMDIKNSVFCLNNMREEALEFFRGKLNTCHPSLRYDVYMYLFDFLASRGGIQAIDELIKEEKDIGLRAQLEKLKAEIVEEYVISI